MASISRSTANRAVHLRITPRPSNISDSREILRLVSQFGEVEYYKNLKYDTLSHPSASLVIFRDEAAAQSCLKRSPIRFRLGPAPAADADDQPQQQHSYNTPTPAAATPPQANPSPLPTNSPKGPISTPFGLSHSRSLSTSSLPVAPRPTPSLPFLHADPSSTSTSHPQTSRIFQLQTNPARTNFRDQIDRAEYHGRFVVDTKSAIQQDLAKRVPTLGLSAWEWRKPEKPDRVVQRTRSGEKRRSLMEIWEEGRGIDEV